MTSVSRPLIGLLVAAVAFFAVWTLALKPSSSSSGGTKGGLGPFQSTIDKAHRAVANSQSAAAAQGSPVTATPTARAAGSATTPNAITHAVTARPAAKSPIATGAIHARTATQRHDTVVRALRTHKVVALLFFNPRGADDRAVRAELASVPTHGGRVVKLAVPLVELTRYPVITRQVPINGSPTLVLIDRTRTAGTIVGFTDRFEISERVDQALAVKPPLK